MKLYYTPGACSMADHIALIEAGLPFETEKVDLKTKQTADGIVFTDINPKGYVPALQLDDGTILTENIAILSYIGDKSGKLFPPSGLPHWRVLEMLAYISTELHKNFKPFFNPASSEAEKDEGKAALGKRFALIAQQMGSGQFVLGDEMTVADCYLFVMLTWAIDKFEIDVPGVLTAYHARMKERPTVKQAMADEGLV